MKHINILKRAFNITVQYRALWFFGILLALTAGGSSSGSGGGNGGGSGGSSNNDMPDFNGEQFFRELQRQMTPEVINIIIGVSIAVVCLLLVLAVISTIVRYVAETALIRMVDEHENNGEKLSVRQGFQLGWSAAARNIFLMEFLIGFGALIVFLAALMIAAVPLLAWATPNEPVRVLGTVIAIGLMLLVIFAMILIGVAISVIMLFAKRVVAIENLGIGAAIKRSFEIIKARLSDVVVMGVIMYGIKLLFTIVMIPVFLAILISAALVGGLPALLVGGILSTFMQNPTPWIVAGIIGVPLFILVIAIPATIIEGWEQVFTSSTWTLTYREALALIKVKESVEPAEPATPEIA